MSLFSQIQARQSQLSKINTQILHQQIKKNILDQLINEESEHSITSSSSSKTDLESVQLHRQMLNIREEMKRSDKGPVKPYKEEIEETSYFFPSFDFRKTQNIKGIYGEQRQKYLKETIKSTKGNIQNKIKQKQQFLAKKNNQELLRERERMEIRNKIFQEMKSQSHKPDSIPYWNKYELNLPQRKLPSNGGKRKIEKYLGCVGKGKDKCERLKDFIHEEKMKLFH